MKRLLIVVLVITIAFLPRLVWSMKESKPLTVQVVDKTVPKKDYREHNGLFQVLDYEKVSTPSGELYDIGKDYFGFDPYDKVPGVTYQSETEPDLIYITDTYGVFDDDLEEKPDGKKSGLIDGGMDLLEWNAIMSSKSPKSTLIAEFNSFASPTEEFVSDIMQKNVSVRWDGWIGRHFPDFENEEIPQWLIQGYEDQNRKPWQFTGDGIVFVHTSGEIVVLDDALTDGQIEFTPTEIGMEQFPSISSAPYLYWFDIVEPLEGAETLARYSFELTEKGKSVMKDSGIPTDFPAVIHHKQNKTYYFAGDYADFEKRAFTKWQGVPMMYKYFATDYSEFYWKSYFPLLSTIISNIHEEKVR